MKSRLWAAAAISAAMILCLAGVAVGQDKVSASEWVEQIGNKGSVNWTDGYVEAVGIGAPPQRNIGSPQARPMALRAAQIDAYRNLLEVVSGVRVDSTTTIRDFVVESDIINTQVQGMVKGAKTMKQEYLSDGTVEVTVRMPLSGNCPGSAPGPRSASGDVWRRGLYGPCRGRPRDPGAAGHVPPDYR